MHTRSSRFILVIGMAVVLRSPASAQQREVASSNPTIVDVPAALASVPAEGTTLKFARGDIEVPRGGHLQGIQMRFDAAGKRHLAFLSHDSLSVGYLVIVEFPADSSAEGRVIHVHHFPSDGRSPPLRHAGGFQLAGDVLAVGLEDNQLKTRSEIQFWNMAGPNMPTQFTHLTVYRSGVPKDMTAGAVGLVRRENDHLLAVGNWDSRAIDLYRSNGKQLDDSGCRFEFHTRWRDDRADKSNWKPDSAFAAHQAINLVADSSGTIFLIAFATDSAGKNVVDLFSLDMSQKPEGLLRKLASKPVQLQAGSNFRAAGGAWNHDGSVSILAGPHELGTQTLLNIARGH
jgi:hypothetical protein